MQLWPSSGRGRVLFGSSLILLAVLGAELAWSYHVGCDRVRSSVRRELLAIAVGLGPQLTGDAIERAAQQYPGRDAVRSWSTAPHDLREQRDILVTAADKLGFRTPIYVMVPRHDRQPIRVGEGPGPWTRPDRVVFTITTADTPYWLHDYPYAPAMTAALRDGREVSTEVYEDEHGQWISAYAPVRNTAGEIIGVLSVDATLDQLYAALHDQLILEGSVMLGAFVVLALGLYLVFTNFARWVRGLERVAARFEAGAFDEPIEVGGPSEVAQILGAFEYARSTLAENERRLVEQLERAEQANESKERFLMLMSHEFRTPLNGIDGNSTLLRETPLDEWQRGLLDDLDRATTRVTDLVESIMDYAQWKSASIALNQEEVTAEQLLAPLRDRFSKEASERRIEFDIEMRRPLCRYRLDVRRVQQIYKQVVQNAIKFTLDGTKVECILDYEDEGGRLLFSVSDEGPGIADEHRDKIFESFVQVHAAENRPFEGAGLGLTIARRLVEAMGGTLGFVRLPRGTRFEVRLPTTELRPLPRPGIPAEATERWTVLVAEDNEANRRILTHFLERRNHRVLVAVNGEEAVSLWSEHRGEIDVILMDLQMPVMTGLEAALEIREREAQPPEVEVGRTQCPILAVTADTREATERRCREAGMNGYVTKPLKPKVLFAAIGRAIEATSRRSTVSS